jgi:hypothetical protein
MFNFWRLTKTVCIRTLKLKFESIVLKTRKVEIGEKIDVLKHNKKGFQEMD